MSEAASEYKLECYQIKKNLGTGGNLWLVEDSVTGKQLVMRRLSRSHEAVYRILEKLCHPNLTEVQDVFCCHGFLYVVERFLEGKTLTQVLEEQGASKDLACSVAKQILAALCVLHANGIIHRDIKPDNIRMDSQGTARLMDFDIARLFSEEKGADTTPKGTRAYAPPEQYGFQQTDYRADIYSLGVTVNEAATGNLPEAGVCGGFLGIFVRRCTELDPKRRYQTARQALTQLGRLEKRRQMVALSAVAALGLTVAVGAWMVQRPAATGSAAQGGPAASGLMAAEESVVPGPAAGQDTAGSGFMAEEESPASGSMAEEPPASGLLTFEDIAGPYLGDWGLRRGSSIEQYPSLFLEDEGEYAFVMEMEDGRQVLAAMEKTPEELVFSCALGDQDPAVFRFDDIMLRETGQKPGVFCFNDGILQEIFQESDGQEPVPDPATGSREGQDPGKNWFFAEFGPDSKYEYKYEIMTPDYDGDGDREFVIILGRCRWIEPPNPAYAYLQVGYCLVWFLDVSEDGSWNGCQEPFWVEGTPTFDYDFRICDPANPFAGYRWSHGEWVYVPDPYGSAPDSP